MSNLSNFIKSTQSGQNNTNKDFIRVKLRDDLIEFFENDGMDKVRLLTLPSVWWRFERLVYNITRKKKCFFPHVTACERDRKLFSLASMNIPKSKSSVSADYGIDYFFNEDYGCDVSRTQSAKIHCIDVFDYLLLSNHKFDFVWLDLISPINFFIDNLHLLGRKTAKKSMVAITFLKGRDGQIYVGNREYFVTRKMNMMGFELYESVDYFDTCPMMHLVYRKI